MTMSRKYRFSLAQISCLNVKAVPQTFTVLQIKESHKSRLVENALPRTSEKCV